MVSVILKVHIFSNNGVLILVIELTDHRLIKVFFLYFKNSMYSQCRVIFSVATKNVNKLFIIIYVEDFFKDEIVSDRIFDNLFLIFDLDLCLHCLLHVQ